MVEDAEDAHQHGEVTLHPESGVELIQDDQEEVGLAHQEELALLTRQEVIHWSKLIIEPSRKCN